MYVRKLDVRPSIHIVTIFYVILSIRNLDVRPSVLVKPPHCAALPERSEVVFVASQNQTCLLSNHNTQHVNTQQYDG